MTKTELINILADKTSLTLDHAEKVVSSVFGVMTDALVEGQRVEIRGFGVFSVKDYKGYTGRNPKTGESVDVAPKRLPVFKVGKELQTMVNDHAKTAGD